MEQPFDKYKNKNVEYDYVIQADVNLNEFNKEQSKQLYNLITDEDFLYIYFPQVALGRVYPKFDYLNDKLHIIFGISLVDSTKEINSKNLLESVKEFILSLNKNIEIEPKLDIREGDIHLDILTENKNVVDNIDKKLVSESILQFCRNNDRQVFNLTDDGIIEHYANNKLINSFSFSKLGILRECKTLIQEGYNLTEFQENDENNVVDNADEIKQNLENDIKNVEEIQTLKDELEDKLDALNEENTYQDNYALVVYTNINGNYEPDVTIKEYKDNEYTIADSIENTGKYDKETAEYYADQYNKNNSNEHILKVVKFEDLNSLNNLFENKHNINENLQDENFPSTEFTSNMLTKLEIDNLNLISELTVEQVAWLQSHFGDIDVIVDGMKDIAKEYDDDTAIISIDDYVKKLYNYIKED